MKLIVLWLLRSSCQCLLCFYQQSDSGRPAGESYCRLLVLNQFSRLVDGSQIQHDGLNTDQHVQDIFAWNLHWDYVSNVLTNNHASEMSISVVLASAQCCPQKRPWICEPNILLRKAVLRCHQLATSERVIALTDVLIMVWKSVMAQAKPKS